MGAAGRIILRKRVHHWRRGLYSVAAQAITESTAFRAPSVDKFGWRSIKLCTSSLWNGTSRKVLHFGIDISRLTLEV